MSQYMWEKSKICRRYFHSLFDQTFVKKNQNNLMRGKYSSRILSTFNICEEIFIAPNFVRLRGIKYFSNLSKVKPSNVSDLLKLSFYVLPPCYGNQQIATNTLD